MVVGFPAGGTTDVMARVAAAPLRDALGQPVVIENRPGASGNIAASEVMRAPADGYTFMIAPISVRTANPMLFKPALDIERGMTPVVSMGYAQLYLVARKDLKADTPQQLQALAQASPGQLSYGSGGAGTQMHLVGELFKQQAQVDVIHVPYRGAAPAMQDILGGQIDYYFDPASGFQHIREGKAKLLAVTGTHRSSFFPEAPTLTEAGIEGVELGNWFGVFAPTNTPAPIIQRMADAVKTTMALPAVQRSFSELGVEPIVQDTTTFSATINAEAAVLKQLIETRGISLE
ncbi:tripartite tricarboxylate transporter substrate binding protein [Lampropedia puyangensis]|uniref:Tripartite tricarboxylate transporter substrate binding protein n=2 Tax=Lampropedia puyangensis TaxID=1330072 RepID=A0A4S8EY13_9BURK|nr:tripartite tricarboxylate transporter substrate binding protein [Lampropedia puyangensis]